MHAQVCKSVHPAAKRCTQGALLILNTVSPYSVTVVYVPGTNIGFSVSAVSSSCLRTKEQGVVGEQGIVGLE